MRSFERRRHLERSHVHSLRIDAGKDVPDGAVFAAGVHCLKHDKQGMLALRKEDFLEIAELFIILLEPILAVFFLLEFACVLRRVILQAKLRAGLHQIWALDLHAGKSTCSKPWTAATFVQTPIKSPKSDIKAYLNLI